MDRRSRRQHCVGHAIGSLLAEERQEVIGALTRAMQEGEQQTESEDPSNKDHEHQPLLAQEIPSDQPYHSHRPFPFSLLPPVRDRNISSNVRRIGTTLNT